MDKLSRKFSKHDNDFVAAPPAANASTVLLRLDTAKQLRLKERIGQS